MGKGKNPKTDQWDKDISMHIDKSTREFDVVNIEEELKRSHEAIESGGKGSVGVIFPRVYTGNDGAMRQELMKHERDPWWIVSPWEIAGKPDPYGNRETEPMDFPWDMNTDLFV